MSKHLRIVIADDHPLFLDGVARSLGEDDWIEVVAVTHSGEDAVELVSRLLPDVVLLDISMPGIGGIEAARQIGAILPAIPIVMLTASEDQDSLFAALKAGAHGYVLKGVSAGELRDIVHRIAAGESYVTPALAAAMLFEFTQPDHSRADADLTSRETEVLELLGQGLTNREIGERLFLAEKTIKHYITAVLQKLHVRSRTEAALIAVKRDQHPRPNSPRRAH